MWVLTRFCPGGGYRHGRASVNLRERERERKWQVEGIIQQIHVWNLCQIKHVINVMWLWTETKACRDVRREREGEGEQEGGWKKKREREREGKKTGWREVRSVKDTHLHITMTTDTNQKFRDDDKLQQQLNWRHIMSRWETFGLWTLVSDRRFFIIWENKLKKKKKTLFFTCI